MLPQKLPKLIFERSLSMMFRLSRDVIDHRLQIRHRHAEHPISLLPREQMPALVHPLRRIRLDHADGVGDGNFRRQCHQDMHVILGPTDGNDVDRVFLRNADYVRVHAIRLADPGTPAFGTEDEVNVIAGVGVSHAITIVRHRRAIQARNLAFRGSR